MKEDSATTKLGQPAEVEFKVSGKKRLLSLPDPLLRVQCKCSLCKTERVTS